MPERVHRHQRREARGVAEVVAIRPAGERRAGRRLGGEEAHLRLAAQHLSHEGEAQSGEVRAAPHAADNHVRLLTCHLHLRGGLLTDDRLMQQHVIEHRAERVVRVFPPSRDLDRLGDGDAQRARGVCLLVKPRAGQRAGGTMHGGAPGLHHRAAVGLLVVGGADHEDLAVQPEQRAGERQGGSPLARARLGHQPPHTGAGVLVGLRDSRVRLVRAGRRDSLVLVVDVRRRIERRLEPPGAEQRRRPPALVDVADLIGDLHLGVLRDLLHDQPHGEDRREVRRPGRLQRLWVQRRERLARQFHEQVDPVRWHLALG